MLHYAILLPDEQICVDRVRARIAGARIDPRHVLAPPPDDAAGAAETIRDRLAGGRLRYREN